MNNLLLLSLSSIAYTVIAVNKEISKTAYLDSHAMKLT